MSIMRRGPLDRYLPVWVLRSLAGRSFDGSVTFDRPEPATFYFEGGAVYAATSGNPEAGDGPPAGSDDEEAYQAEAVRLLIEVQCSVGGSYALDPLGQHPTIGSWRWDLDELLATSRAESSEVTAASICGNQRIQLRDDGAKPTTRDPDALALAARLHESITTEEVRTSLGWRPARLLTALMKLHREGLLDAAAEPEPEPTAPTESERPGLADLFQRADDGDGSGPPADDEVAADGPPPATTGAGAAPSATDADAHRSHLKRDLGIDDNAPANMALRAWQEHQIPEVILDPLVAPKEWLPEPEPTDEVAPKRRRLRPGRRSRQQDGDTT